MAVNATNDEVLANQLWGKDKYYWRDDFGQYVEIDGKYDSRKKGGESPSAGGNSPASSAQPKTSDASASKVLPSTAPTTGPSSSPAPTASSTAASTAGSGTASKSPGSK